MHTNVIQGDLAAFSIKLTLPSRIYGFKILFSVICYTPLISQKSVPPVLIFLSFPLQLNHFLHWISCFPWSFCHFPSSFFFLFPFFFQLAQDNTLHCCAVMRDQFIVCWLHNTAQKHMPHFPSKEMQDILICKITQYGDSNYPFLPCSQCDYSQLCHS